MKIITKENWNQVDPTCEAMLALSLEKLSAYPMFPELWLDLILEPHLSENVSAELKSLFETARGAMVYGYFYYPLFSIGTEQLYKLTEAAISEKYAICGGPEPVGKQNYVNLGNKINWLKKCEIIDQEQWERFDNIRASRNITFHPKAQSILPPAFASSSLSMAAEWINELFNGSLD